MDVFYINTLASLHRGNDISMEGTEKGYDESPLAWRSGNPNHFQPVSVQALVPWKPSEAQLD